MLSRELVHLSTYHWLQEQNREMAQRSAWTLCSLLDVAMFKITIHDPIPAAASITSSVPR